MRVDTFLSDLEFNSSQDLLEFGCTVQKPLTHLTKIQYETKLPLYNEKRP